MINNKQVFFVSNKRISINFFVNSKFFKTFEGISLQV